MYIYGRQIIKKLLKTTKVSVEGFYVNKSEKGPLLEDLRKYSSQKRIRIELRDSKSLSDMVKGQNHQGFVARIKDFTYKTEDYIDEIDEGKSGDFYLALDQVQDPQNLGSIARSAFQFGCKGLIIPRNKSVMVTPVVIKSSAGLIMDLPVLLVTNLKTALQKFKRKNYWVVGTGFGEQDIHQSDLKRPVVLVMGNEGAGMRPLIDKTCDYKVSIPMARKDDSLNVANAASIAVYEIYRQSIDS